ncbi:DUF4256 domain-containing protein [Chryseobacterium sp. MP_3.2]|uniref:DUF4256 domain-containing protein n=1 Tax=Chryseobacterium sp. MP_3.2 TaxID=3071712 RepID=UPI002DFFECC8|nr:hypothetical protein [Chryseobacterium sp. MP_3.2]
MNDNSTFKSLLETLESRFEENRNRHPTLDWKDLEKRLLDQPVKLQTLQGMEESGGEPALVNLEVESGEYVFFDCAKESPKERRSFCYDHKALEKRKENKPKNSAENFAKQIGAELLDEEEYRHLQTLGNFDNKTSSWLKTPEKIRNLGGAIFGDFRFETVFVYHNGAESYYASRGFRCVLRV